MQKVKKETNKEKSMRVYGHCKVVEAKTIKIGEEDFQSGKIAWQLPKERDAGDNSPLKFSEIGFMMPGRRGENFVKYSKDKSGHPRYMFIEGDLKMGRSAWFIFVRNFDFIPWEPRPEPVSGSGGGLAGLSEDDVPF